MCFSCRRSLHFQKRNTPKKWEKATWDPYWEEETEDRPDRPQHIGGPSSSQYWTIAKAITEFSTNLIDQARVTAEKLFPEDTPRVLHWKSRNKKGKITVVFYAEGTDLKLAEIMYERKKKPYIQSYRKVSKKYEPFNTVSEVSPWELTLVNYASYIRPSAFLRGVSGQEKRNNALCIGKFGDGLTTAIDTLCRRAVTVTVVTYGFTARGILDINGHSFAQFESNRQGEHKVAITLTFMPEEHHLYRMKYTDHARDPHDPETFDPMSIFLSESADRVPAIADDPDCDSSAILLGEGMKGKRFNRGIPVCDKGDSSLFGYNLGDKGRNLIQGRDRSGMDPKLESACIDQLLKEWLEKSPRLRREVVLALTRGCEWGTARFEDMRVRKWGDRVLDLLRQESKTMFPGTVLAKMPNSLQRLIAELRGLEVETCHPDLDEGSALVTDFIEELRSLPREEIGAESGWASTVREKLLQLTGATELASVEFPGKIGAQHVVWVEKDVVLISRRSLKVDLKKEDYKTAMFLLRIIKSSMARRDGFFQIPQDRAFAIYHLIMTAEHRPEGVPSPPAVENESPRALNRAMSGNDEGVQGLPEGRAEDAGDASRGAAGAAGASPSAVVNGAPDASSGVAAGSGVGAQRLPGGGGEDAGNASRGASEAEGSSPSAMAANAPNGAIPGSDEGLQGLQEGGGGNAGDASRGAVEAEVASPSAMASAAPNGLAAGSDRGAEGLPRGEENAGDASHRTIEESAVERGRADMAVADEGGDESDGVGGGGMEEDDSPEGVEGNSLCSQKRKRACDAVSREGAARGEQTSTRLKQEVSGSGRGGSGAASSGILAQEEPVAEKAAAGFSSVAVKVEEQRSFEGRAPSAPLQLNGVSPAEASEVALAQPGRSVKHVLQGLGGVNHGAEGGEEADPLAQGAAGAAAPIALPARDGEELPAFLSEGSGDLVPALIHVERHAVGGGTLLGTIDLYRVAGRMGNEAELWARFAAVMASQRARSVTESAVRTPGVDLSFFSSSDALPAFVGDGGRVFVNLHDPSSKTVDEWATDDLPTHIATQVAHVRSATSGNAHSHAGLIEFRKFVISQEQQA